MRRRIRWRIVEKPVLNLWRLPAFTTSPLSREFQGTPLRVFPTLLSVVIMNPRRDGGESIGSSATKWTNPGLRAGVCMTE
jgi:hypothetical protein